MMYIKFKKDFSITDEFNDNVNEEVYQNLPSELLQFFSEIGGNSFDNGIYKTHTVKTSVHWATLIASYFDHYRGLICPFGFDWMGRQFCLSVKDANKIFMFDPATREDFALEQNLADFHNRDLVLDKVEMLAKSNFNNILALLKLDKIGYSDCLGYKVPLFLNGKDSLHNFEKVNIEVYWDILIQLYDQIKNLPAGTPISSIKIERNN